MLEKLIGPKYTLKDALLILEQGLRNGEITLDGKADSENERIPVLDVYIPLRNGGMEVLKPTKGLLLDTNIVQVLATTDYDPTIEDWEFPPGSKVRCVSEVKGDRKLLVARQRVM